LDSANPISFKTNGRPAFVGVSGNWAGVKQIETACRDRQIPFSLIYWAAGYPELQRKGLADDSTWYMGIMQQGYEYAMVNGRPDQIDIESWAQAPSHFTPETGQWTFSRAALDFLERFGK
jgi:hypothetical protein